MAMFCLLTGRPPPRGEEGTFPTGAFPTVRTGRESLCYTRDPAGITWRALATRKLNTSIETLLLRSWSQNFGQIFSEIISSVRKVGKSWLRFKLFFLPLPPSLEPSSSSLQLGSFDLPWWWKINMVKVVQQLLHQRYPTYLACPFLS